MSGDDLRDEGMARVVKTHPAFSILYGKFLEEVFWPRYEVGNTFTGEHATKLAKKKHRKIREMVENGRVHPNAWGGVFSGFISSKLKDRLVTRIGTQQMQEPKSHSRRTAVYERIA